MTAPTTVRGFQIRNLDDLGKVHESFGTSNWLHVAIEDPSGRAYLLAEHDDGEMYVYYDDQWVSAEFVVKHHSPLMVLSKITVTS